MSKSKKNVVAPEDIFDTYGVDAARLFVLSDSPPERDVQWSTSGVEGSWRFTHRVWAEFAELSADEVTVGDEFSALELRKAAHKCAKLVTEGFDHFRFNSAIAKLYELVNILRSLSVEKTGSKARREALDILARLIAPVTPHLAEACWTKLGHSGLVVNAPWPQYDRALAIDEEISLPVQFNGKKRCELLVPAEASEDQIRELALEDEAIKTHLTGLTIKKIIVVRARIINFVVG